MSENIKVGDIVHCPHREGRYLVSEVIKSYGGITHYTIHRIADDFISVYCDLDKVDYCDFTTKK